MCDPWTNENNSRYLCGSFPLLEGEFCGHFDFPVHQYVSRPSRWASQINNNNNKVACKYFYWHKDFSPVPTALREITVMEQMRAARPSTISTLIAGLVFPLQRTSCTSPPMLISFKLSLVSSKLLICDPVPVSF